MKNHDFLVLETINDKARCCVELPCFKASVGDLVETKGNGMCVVMYRFYLAAEDISNALTDAYGSDKAVAVYARNWSACDDEIG